MNPQTYCSRADIEAAWTPAAVLAAVDDDSSGTLSADEEAIIARAIERAANRMNAALEMRYALSQLAGNTWCRDCNAMLAAYLLATRRGNPAPDQIQELYEALLDDLEEIVAGRLRVPQVADGVGPGVSNFAVDPARGAAAVQPVASTSVAR